MVKAIAPKEMTLLDDEHDDASLKVSMDVAQLKVDLEDVRSI